MTASPPPKILADHPVLAEGILQGVHMLEADAGCGKTWTIARLVLRALLERSLSIEQIAVLTFTRAAAAELKERIGALLATAQRHYESDGDLPDPFFAAYEPARPRAECVALLRRARLQLDDAPILTIHSFCQRILGDHALSMGCWQPPRLIEHSHASLRRIVADWWRCEIVPQAESLVPLVEPDHLSVERLVALLSRALADPGARLLPEPVVAWRELPDRLRAAADAVGRGAREEGDALCAWLRGPDSPAHQPSQERNLRRWLEELQAFCADWPASRGSPPKALIHLDARTLINGFVDRQTPFACELPWKVAALNTLRHACGHVVTAVAIDLRAAVEAKLNALVRDEGELSYDGMLVAVRRAVRDPDRGDALAARMRRCWPLAIVDEFQDTDPVQWDIFEAVYAKAAPEACGLVLVGDPKQAIYSFRNADVRTYLRARDAADARHRLLENQRANADLLAALNTLFGRENPFLEPGIEWQDARPGVRAQDAERQAPDDGAGALTVVDLQQDGEEGTTAAPFADTGTLEERAAQATAREIRRLIAEGVAEPRAIAVLVPTRAVGAIIQRSLLAVGVGAVEVSNASVFRSETAADLERLLAAVASPSDPALVRGALVGRLLGRNLAQVRALQSDSVQWAQCLARLAACRDEIARVGLQPALRRLLFADLGRHEVLAGSVAGERRLTDLLHLLDALTADPDACGSAAQACRMLARMRDRRDDDGEADEELRLRLESDESLVRIHTVHGAKGLEWDFVFLPFAWKKVSGSPDRILRWSERSERFLMLADRRKDDLASLEGGACVDGPAAHTASRDAEAMRLAYVALTRARRRCYLFWGVAQDTANKSHQTVIAYLAQRAASGLHAAPPTATRVALRELAQAAGPRCIGWCDWRDLGLTAGSASTQPGPASGQDLPAPQVAGPVGSLIAPLRPASVLQRDVRPAWTVRSFTAIAAGFELPGPLGAAPQVSADPDPGRPDHDQALAQPTPDESAPIEGALPVADSTGSAVSRDVRATFTGGADAGICLHAILEEADFARGHEPTRVADRLRRHHIDADPHAVVRWLDTVLRCDLADPAQAFWCVADVDADAAVREMPFTLGAADCDDARLAEIVAREFPLPPLPSTGWRGFLDGFIDLVVRHHGLWWILDWKSNRLGERASDYSDEAMGQSIQQHGYALQFCLYALALHRTLRMRLPDYDYERDFGGVRYLFLRGIEAGGAQTGIYRARPTRALIEALDLALGEADRR